MKVADIKTKAKEMGIKVGKLTKANLIVKIQEEEGNKTCFGTGTSECDQLDCAWRSDCIS